MQQLGKRWVNVLKKGQRRTAVVLGGNLGDAVIYSTALQPIRQAFPDDELTLIARPEFFDLFGSLEFIDRTLSAHRVIRGPWLRARVPARRHLARWTRRIWSKRYAFDRLVFLNQFVSPLELELADVIQAEEVWGFTGGSYLGAPPSDWDSRLTHPLSLSNRDRRGEHLLVPLGEFLTRLGFQGPWNSTQPLEALGSHFPAKKGSRGISKDGLGVIFPGCSYRSDIKLWPSTRYAEAIEAMGVAAPKRWIVCGQSDEAELCHDVAEHIVLKKGLASVDVECGLGLKDLVSLLAEASFSLGVDNGGLHLAVALGVPSVTIVSGAVGGLYFPWGDPSRHQAVTEVLDCWYCNYQCVYDQARCVVDIQAKRVAQLADRVLTETGSTPEQ
ncbi:MAG: hypothetical protein CBC48_16955 [bacterium TMED88]|nr:hypothetical protein [Deltaproteobacteria bacterium]OUV24977.1 MAG: hypothetical protein CBC48_16955 [bacterium TMED88]